MNLDHTLIKLFPSGGVSENLLEEKCINHCYNKKKTHGKYSIKTK